VATGLILTLRVLARRWRTQDEGADSDVPYGPRGPLRLGGEGAITPSGEKGGGWWRGPSPASSGLPSSCTRCWAAPTTGQGSGTYSQAATGAASGHAGSSTTRWRPCGKRTTCG